MKNIYLCGFMGCGKSTLGTRISTLLGRKYIDTDLLIEENHGMSVTDMFEIFGEKHFRDIETQTLIEVSQKNNCVVSTGGGICAREENRKLLFESGTTIFLDVPFEICYDHIKDCQTRPLIKTHTKEEIEALYKSRYDVYKSVSSFSFPIKGSPEHAAQNLAKQLRQLGL